MTTYGVGMVSRRAGDPAQLEEITLQEPGPGEVLVRLLASGICHTDLHYKLGNIGNEFPYLLGHEGSGTVEQVGEGVTFPRVGDYVVLAWRAPCGYCRFCAIGQLNLCSASLNAEPKMTTRKDNLTMSQALGIGTLCSHTVIAAKQAVPVPVECPPEQACLLGCGVTTGVGAALYTAGVRRGSSVAVFGCGGIGTSVIMGAKLAGARQVIGVDIAANKLTWAKEFGATDVVDATNGDPVEAIKEMTDGHGVDYSFEAVGDAGNIAAGLVVPRPGRYLHLDRRAQPDHDYGIAHAAVLRFGRGAASKLVRRLPSLQGFPVAGELLP